ncbi:MAG: DUF805 domain-containing protein [Nitrospira sp.]|nr:DUF805 domain-containing protein [Nitrospira sp.]
MAPIELDYIKDLFSAKGRVKRLRFFITQIIIGCFFGGVAVIISALSDNIFPHIFLPLSIYPIACNCIKRLHDLEKSGLYALLLLVPVLNGFLMLALLLFSGTKGTNIYGQEP